jgi:excisionase family DNA binding protein
MEKICIVKRRQQYAPEEVKRTVQDSQNVTLPLRIEVIDTAVDNRHKFPGEKAVEEFNDDSGHIISIIMTNEQSSMLQSSEHIRDLLSGRRSDPSLYLKRSPDGRIILNFYLHESPTVHMLRFDQVCQILQISRSFLQKLVHKKTLKSYKLGRLRRFEMEDILDYLISHEELDRHIDGD